MNHHPRTHRRRSIRLPGYDYTQAGAYFITMCTQGRACLFGEVAEGQMRLNAAGQMVLAEWEALPNRFPTVALDAFVVMPNHIHGIITIVGAGLVPAQSPAHAPAHAPAHPAARDGATTRVAPTVGDVVGAFKSLTTVLYGRGAKQSGWPAFPGRLWQRNCYEHIIRNDESLNHIRQYIGQNPLRWDLDRENLAATARQQEEAWER